MGVFDVVTMVVLEAGRLDRRAGGEDARAAPEPKSRRFRLAYLPALPVLTTLLVLAVR